MKKILWITSIHGLHASWILIFGIENINNAALKLSQSVILLWLLAFLLEAIRWYSVGNEITEIKGTHSFARVVEKSNDNFFLFSPYIIPPLPPFKLIEEISKSAPNNNGFLKKRIVFSRFWLNKQIIYIVLFLIVLLGTGIFNGDAPTFGGIIKSPLISCAYWICMMGLFGKLFFLMVFSLFIKIQGD